MNDGKDRFYRNLSLDKEGWEALKFFRKVKEKMMKDDHQEDEKE